jgi:hypothetical protein
MDMSNIADGLPVGEIVVKHMNISKLKDEIERRMQTLSNELPPDAAAQMLEDAGAIVLDIQGHGNSIGADFSVTESYLIKYLSSHSTPVIGGDSGTVHELDGSIRSSIAPKQFYGTPVPWLELPNLDCKEEMTNFLNVLLPLYTEEAIPEAGEEIKELIAPKVKEIVANEIGGMLK